MKAPVSVGDLIGYNPESHGGEWIDKVGLVLADGLKPLVPFEGWTEERILLVRWAETGNNVWVNAEDVIVISKAEIKKLTRQQK